jgi:hypothetical protein
MPKDFCDVIKAMRAHFFAKDRDVSLVVNRKFILQDGTQLSDQDDIFPSGIVCMWSGAIVDIPGGWSLCDGSGSTPDLRNLFIVGAGDSYNVGDTGGDDTVNISHTHGDGSLSTGSAGSHNHDGDTGNIASHYHSLNAGTSIASTSGGDYEFVTNSEPGHNHSISSDGSHTHPVNGTTATGGDTTHDNRPAFYALAFIQKD